MKLSEAQKRTLQRMADGDEVWVTGVREKHCFWHGNIGARAPSSATMWNLDKRGLVEDYTGQFSDPKYRITDAGRAALREE